MTQPMQVKKSRVYQASKPKSTMPIKQQPKASRVKPSKDFGLITNSKGQDVTGKFSAGYQQTHRKK